MVHVSLKIIVWITILFLHYTLVPIDYARILTIIFREVRIKLCTTEALEPFPYSKFKQFLFRFVGPKGN